MNKHKNLNNLAVISDIHGEYQKLTDILDQIHGKYPDHFIISLGDLCDRGQQTFEVVEVFKHLHEAGKGMVLMSNHDAWCLRAADHNPDPNWLRCGGRDTVASYVRQMKKPFPEAFHESGHYKLLTAAPLYYEDKHVFLSHAPVPKDVFLAPYAHDKAVWSRNEFIMTWSWHGKHRQTNEATFARDHGKLSICGHVHMLEKGIARARHYDHVLYLDSGCGCHPQAPLSCAIVEDGKLIEILESGRPSEVQEMVA